MNTLIYHWIFLFFYHFRIDSFVISWIVSSRILPLAASILITTSDYYHYNRLPYIFITDYYRHTLLIIRFMPLSSAYAAYFSHLFLRSLRCCFAIIITPCHYFFICHYFVIFAPLPLFAFISLCFSLRHYWLHDFFFIRHYWHI